ncbi:type VI secretion system lipoprotein TssJ [Cupriavidus basilensis]|uniref:Type VI secretion lipoprotein/VasD n=1 Tax=Cupriavidus basilensis TaxID=68895 RepID=A0A0C4YC28_9BURK|nr:type VI secretion system lipoprotein TssJ [Cupriavidus basilensis]AJG18146.1 Type VI secretion lipoprotein/VasD [Cupriavidus basilensis]
MRQLYRYWPMAIALLAGCAASPVQNEQMKLVLRAEAKPTVNPDARGRASPVLVRMYELKSDGTFANADYFTLQSADKTLLLDDLLARDEFILRPDETRDFERKLNPATTALGFLVGYNDLGKATWRTVYKLPPATEAAWYRAVVPARKIKLQVLLDQLTINITKIE